MSRMLTIVEYGGVICSAHNDNIIMLYNYTFECMDTKNNLAKVKSCHLL